LTAAAKAASAAAAAIVAAGEEPPKWWSTSRLYECTIIPLICFMTFEFHNEWLEISLYLDL
jgi:hypothetical protein